MQHAPAVQYPVGRARLHLLLIVLLGVLGALALSGWMAMYGDILVRHAVGWTVWLATLVWAGLAWWRAPVGDLAWSGDGWSWTQRGQVSAVALQTQLQLDLQHTLLLRLVPPVQRANWLWLERSRQPLRWSALRRAVFAPIQAAPGAAAHESLA